MSQENLEIKKHIRSIPDWPEKGVIFRDITALLENRTVFRKLIDTFVYRYHNEKIDAIVGIDARGFIIGAPLAYLLNTCFIPVRKKGKLPGETISQSYELEYGEAEVEIHVDALQKGDRVLLIDDLIATGGTMNAAAKLLTHMEVEIVEAAAIIDLPDLGGSDILKGFGLEVFSLSTFPGK